MMEKTKIAVTILILIDGFLQSRNRKCSRLSLERHNPYFNRWFSAIQKNINQKICVYVSQSLF